MRADPEHRRPAPPPRRADFLPVAARAWGLLLIFARRSPGLVLAGAIAFAASEMLPVPQGDDHGNFGVVGLYVLLTARFALPAVVGAGLFLSMQRMFMAGGSGGFAALRQYTSWARVSAALIALKILGAAAFWCAATLPTFLRVLLGPVSAVLTLLLLAPLFVVAAICVVRLSLTPPAQALGLRGAATESWEITRGRVLRVLGVWLVTSAPVAAVASALDWWGEDGYFLDALPLGLLALLLSGAVSSLLYKSYRLPTHLRPDRRPSRNRSRRSEPALAK